MKSFVRSGIIGISILTLSATVGFAQDDETRQASGLPMMIGGGSKTQTPLSGKVTLLGLDTSKPKPTIIVSVYVSGGLIDKRQANESGSYYIPSVPREGIVLSVEVGGIEVGRYQLAPLISGSIRQDVTINMGEISNSKNPSSIISAKDFYQRSEKNMEIYEKAISASKEKKNDIAIKFFNELLKNDPKDFVSWTELGTLYFKNEKYGEAETAYIKAIELKQDFIVALLNLGKLYLGKKTFQIEKAILVLTKAVEVEPTSADANHYLGEAYLQNKKGSKAVGYLNEAIKLSPVEKAEIHLSLAALYNGAGLKDKAIEEYKMFLQKVPNFAEQGKIEKYITDNSPK